jgi:hypothetical protein
VPELARHGFKLTIHTGTLIAAYTRMRDAMRELKETGTLPVAGGEFDELVELMGVPEVEALAEKYSE